MKIFYDTEFIEDGLTIEPLAIGMHREDGAELYCVSDSMEQAIRGCGLEWIYENVMTKLPYMLHYDAEQNLIVPRRNSAHPDFLAFASVGEIATKVEDFIAETPDPELWADYASYDHVVIAQLFGPMIELPSEVPMFTHEFRQVLEDRGLSDADLPVFYNPDGKRYPHHALFDARELHSHYEFAMSVPLLTPA